MARTGEYHTYRRAGRELVNRIMHASLPNHPMGKAGRALGILQGKTFVFDSETEMYAVADFSLHECYEGGRNAIDAYREKVGPKNDVERALLDGWAASYTSLFRIVSTSPRDHLLVLADLLNDGDDVRLTDVGFSATAEPGLLLFTRIVPVKSFNMASGFSFLFPGHIEKTLLREYERLEKKLKSDPESAARFIAFFKLNQRYGLEVRYQ